MKPEIAIYFAVTRVIMAEAGGCFGLKKWEEVDMVKRWRNRVAGWFHTGALAAVEKVSAFMRRSDSMACQVFSVSEVSWLLTEICSSPRASDEVLGFSTNTQRLPVRLQKSFTFQ